MGRVRVRGTGALFLIDFVMASNGHFLFKLVKNGKKKKKKVDKKKKVSTNICFFFLLFFFGCDKSQQATAQIAISPYSCI